MRRVPFVVFSDLDGTLLDHATYSFEPARPALEALTAAGIPLVLCTSKTRAETTLWRCALRNSHPYIVENGGAVAVPDGYFASPPRFDRVDEGLGIIDLGTRYADLRRALGEIRARTGLSIRGFGDMTHDEIANLCGLTPEAAEMAARREYDEPFVLDDPCPEALEKVVGEARARGLRVASGGRFHHLIGGSDKGRAVRLLRDLFENDMGPLVSVGVGDSLNDEPLLREVDIPALVRKPDGSFEQKIQISELVVAASAGPAGWSEIIMKILRFGV